MSQNAVIIMNCSVEIAAQKKPACHDVIAGIAYCPECGAPCCPTCGRHNVTQLSRVTGYVSVVQGWNEAKKQELKDRRRYGVGTGLHNHQTIIKKPIK